MHFNELLDYLQKKASYRYQLNASEDARVLSQLQNMDESTQASFREALIKYETNVPEYRFNEAVLSLSFSSIHGVGFESDERNTKWKNFESYFDFIKCMITLWPDEILNREVKNSLHGLCPFNRSATILSLAMEFFINLYVQNRESHFTNPAMYTALQRQWKTHIIDPLLDRGCDPDLGICYGLSIVAACFREHISSDTSLDNIDGSQAMHDVSFRILKITKNINKPSNNGVTALVPLVMNKYPESLLLLLLSHGASADICFQSDWTDDVKQPILCHFIRNKNYKKLEFLLRQGASANLMPVSEKDKYFFKETWENETWLSPYQLAVALEDETAISLILQYADIHQQNLVCELSEMEQKRDSSNSNSKMLHQGTQLELQCRNRLFSNKHHLVDTLLTTYGIRCFAKNKTDQSKLAEAVEWLFQSGITGCAKSFLRLPIELMVEETRTNPSFGIFVNSALGETYKDGHHAGQLCKSKILILGGLPTEYLITTLIHEMGHFIDTKLFNLTSVFRCLDEKIKAFETAVTSDLSGLDERRNNSRELVKRHHDFGKYIDLAGSEDWLTARLNDFATLYKNNQNMNSEYFTFFFFECPIRYAQCHPEGSEDGLIAALKHYFPQSMEWLEKQDLLQKRWGQEPLPAMLSC